MIKRQHGVMKWSVKLIRQVNQINFRKISIIDTFFKDMQGDRPCSAVVSCISQSFTCQYSKTLYMYRFCSAPDNTTSSHVLP